MRYIFLITVIIASAMPLQAQWIKQSPIPTAKEITSVCFINSSTGWIFGAEGTVMRTNDSGISWTDQSLPTDNRVTAGLFLDNDHGWIALSGEYQDNNGEIFVTADGGNTWNLQFLDSNCAIRSLSFINQDTGWALAVCRQTIPVAANRNFFLQTTDGGRGWLAIDTLEQSHFMKMDFASSKLGFITGAGLPNMMKTTNGGRSWLVSPHISDGSLTDVFFADDTNGYSCGNNFYFTHNSGTSWSSTFCYYSKAVDMYDVSSGWAVTIDKIFKVINGGADVRYQFTSNKSVMTDVSAIDSSTAYAAGRYVSLYSTKDGGETWKEVSNGTHHDLHCIFFLNEDEGWAGGEDGTLLSTKDGGQHWVYNVTEVPPVLIKDVRFINHETGWFVNGDVYRTRDSGLNWTGSSGLDFPVSGLYFSDEQAGWCVGQAGYLSKSYDGGANWTEQNSGTALDLKAVYFADKMTGWIAGNGIIKRTSDGGENWQEIYSGTGDFKKIRFLDDLTGYFLADSFYIRTNDGGNSWQVFTPQGKTGIGSLEDIFFVSHDIGYLAGGSYILKTTDGGINWESDPELQGVEPNAIFFFNEMKGWIAGNEGAIYKTFTGGAFGIDEKKIEDSPPLFTVFPNPSGDMVFIKYIVETRADVEIGIYTLQGAIVGYYKVSGLNPGDYSFSWDPGNVLSGIYICEIRIGDYRGSEKFVYICR